MHIKIRPTKQSYQNTTSVSLTQSEGLLTTVVNTFFVQSKDENDDFSQLLQLPSHTLGMLVKRTWKDREHVKFKQMLLNLHNQDKMWQCCSASEKTGYVVDILSMTSPDTLTEDSISLLKEAVNQFVLQSTDEQDAPHEPSDEDHNISMNANILEFDDKESAESLTFNPILDNTFYNDATPGTELGKFLSRPVLIDTISWVVGTPFIGTEISPWLEFFNDARIKKKIDNYAFVSCNMHIKVVINASPFISGAMLFAYSPEIELSPTTWTTSTTTNPLIQLSQLPHIWAYPQTCSGGEMTLPFFYHKNYLNLTSANDMENMGLLSVTEYVPLALANGGASATCNIQVYAWATDVRLAGNTVKLSLQAKDEYGTGPVSRPASAIAAIGKSLSKVPFIGPFATATAIGAGAVSTIASLFGYTNVPVITDPTPVKNQPFQAITSTQIGTPLEKLTLDPKNELTIDPRVVGLAPRDEMSIASIVQHESYLTQFTWGSTETTDDLLFSSSVLPLLHDRAAILDPAGSYQVYHTPMAHTQWAFWNWRGDIVFRFKFICTKFHKGRVRITWDPSGNIISDAVSTTVAFTRIVDLSEDEDVIVTIPYVQATPWLKTWRNFAGAPWWHTSSFTFDHDPLYTNGTITVRVLNELTGASDLTSIQTMVFVSGGENMEFANPTALPGNASFFSIQSQDEYDTPTQYSAPERYLINFGEAVPSLKVLLRRSCLVDTLGFVNYGNVTALMQILKIWQTKYPSGYGYDPSGLSLAKGQLSTTIAINKPFNYTNNIPFTWFIPMYVGMRGSMHWHFNPSTQGAIAQPLTSVKVIRRHTAITALIENNVSNTSGTDAYATNFFRTYQETAAGGFALTNQITQTGISVSMPMYNQYRMVGCSPLNYAVGKAYDDTNTETYVTVMTAKPAQANNAFRSVNLERYSSIGTDFCAYFFLCVPVLYAYNTTIVTA